MLLYGFVGVINFIKSIGPVPFDNIIVRNNDVFKYLYPFVFPRLQIFYTWIKGSSRIPSRDCNKFIPNFFWTFFPNFYSTNTSGKRGNSELDQNQVSWGALSAGSLCGFPQGVWLGESRRTLENPGPPRNTAEASQPDIWPVFWYSECCKLWWQHLWLLPSYMIYWYTSRIYSCSYTVHTCKDHVLGRMLEKSGCGVPFGTVRFTDRDFADDAVIFAETTEVLAGALDLLSERAEPLGLRVSWIKTKVQAFSNILDATVSQFLWTRRMWKPRRRLPT